MLMNNKCCGTKKTMKNDRTSVFGDVTLSSVQSLLGIEMLTHSFLYSCRLLSKQQPKSSCFSYKITPKVLLPSFVSVYIYNNYKSIFNIMQQFNNHQSIAIANVVVTAATAQQQRLLKRPCIQYSLVQYRLL
jgi:hypothetical protein